MPAPSAWTQKNISILLWVQGFEGLSDHPGTNGDTTE